MKKSFAHRRHENRKVREIVRIMDGKSNMLRPAYQLVNRTMLNPWKDEDSYKHELKRRMSNRIFKEQLDLVEFEREQQDEWDYYMTVVDQCNCYCDVCVNDGWCGGCWCYCTSKN